MEMGGRRRGRGRSCRRRLLCLEEHRTRGGPAGQTMVFNYTIYRTAFRYLDFGYGAAMAFTLTALILGLAVLYLRASARARRRSTSLPP